MGVESATYQVRYGAELGDGFERAVLILGGQLTDDGRTIKAVVSCQQRYWLDLQAWPQRSLASVRVALCNPPEALQILRVTLTALVAVAPADIVDLGGGSSYRDLSDNSWANLSEAFQDQRALFETQFGGFMAAISGEEVFAAVRKRDQSG